MNELVPYVVIGAAVLGAGVLQWHLAAKRRKELIEEAGRLGLRFAPGEGYELLGLPHPLFSRGRAPGVETYMTGSTAGMRARVFDFEYTTGGGKSRTRHSQTVAAFELPGGALPLFELFPERFYHAFAEGLGYKDIDFDGQQAFNESYRLLGQDEAAVRRAFKPNIVARLGELPGWTLEGAGATLLVYRPDATVPASELAAFLETGRALAGLFAAR